MLVRTKIDEMVEFVAKEKQADVNRIAAALKWDPAIAEKIGRILAKAGLAQINYSLNPLRVPTVRIDHVEKPLEEKKIEGKALAEYKVLPGKEGVSTTVKIIEGEGKRPFYYVSMPRVSVYSKAYFHAVRDSISKKLPLETSEKTKEEGEEIYRTRYKLIADVMEKDLGLKKDELASICTILINEMYGLGDLETILSDTVLEELVINSSKLPVCVYHRKYGWMKTNIVVETEEDIENYAAQIGRKVGREINLLHPVLDAHLLSGDRVNATLYPISTSGNTITVRLFARNPWTITSFLKKPNAVLSLEMASLLWQAVHYEMNVIIAGGTGSGKTSSLNALVALIPPHQRIITIEDTRELALPSYMWNWVPFTTRAPNPEGMGEVTMLDLLVNSLRMRPDRIVMGEIRRKKEAEVLFEAMHTGHSVYGTIHADTGTQVVKRLIEPPIEVPPSEVEDINLLLVQYRDRRKNLRRTLELSEIVPGVERPEVNHVYIWRSRVDEFQFVKRPHRYVEQMNLHTGMTEKEILADQRQKGKVLQWMLDNKIEDVDDVGAVMRAYYADEASFVKAVEKGVPLSKIL